MDTSKEYIKMCEKAEEIQKACPLPKPDTEQSVRGYGNYHSACEFVNNIWIPTQSQLQEMVLPLIPDIHIGYVTEEKIWYMTWLFGTQWEVRGSMEQCWLAFCMSVKYNKVWNGTDWIEETA